MNRLPKGRILCKKDDFQRVYNKGRSYANRYMVLYVSPRDDDSSKVGFAAGKKLGNAVVRNRVKRILRESYRLNQRELKKGHELLLVGRKALIGEGCAKAQEAFLQLCQRAGIMREKVMD